MGQGGTALVSSSTPVNVGAFPTPENIVGAGWGGHWLQPLAAGNLYAAGILYNVMLTGQHPSIAIAPERPGGSCENAPP